MNQRTTHRARSAQPKVKLKYSFLKLATALILAVTIALPLANIPWRAEPVAAQTQTNESIWSQPANLSQSGAASQPRVVIGPGGAQMQAFWLDRFDGLVSATYDGLAWSQPQLSPLPSTSQDRTQPAPAIMPFLVADGVGTVHAFWQQVDTDTYPNFQPNNLYTSRMPLGSAAWSAPELIAEDALVFDVYASSSGGLDLAYIRRLNTAAAPAGVFVRLLDPGASAWGPAIVVYSSIYYRLLLPGETAIQISDQGGSILDLIWNDAERDELFQSRSIDRGVIWSAPALFGDPDLQPVNPRLSSLTSTTIALWQASTVSRCSLYQQEASSGAWEAPFAVLTELENCPAGDSLWPQAGDDRIYWVWGEGTSGLSLTVWETAQTQWASPINLTFSFEDAANNRLVTLGDLHTAIAGNTMVVVGNDANGEIWATISTTSLSDLIFAPPPPWAPPERVSPVAQSANSAVVAMDDTGRAHLVWVQPLEQSAIGASILYSSWDSAAANQSQLPDNSTVIFPGNPNQIIRQPAVLADARAQLLHLVWSGAEQGEIQYSRAPLERAGSPNEWFAAQTLSTSPYATWPHLAQDANGKLYVVYAVAVNEERGIYLTQSTDSGQTWSDPQRVVNPATSGLQSVDHPALAASPDGALHLTWVETAPSGNGLPQGIFYASSTDGGQTWSSPAVLTGPGYDLPELWVSGAQLHLFYAQISAENGIIWQRQLSLAGAAPESEAVWSPAARLPGWDEVSLPYGVAKDGPPSSGTLHLVGLSALDSTLVYSAWSAGVWLGPETYPLPGIKPPLAGVQAATRPQAGVLAVALLAQDPEVKEVTRPALYFTNRSVSAAEAPLLPTAQVTPTAVPTLEPTATIYIPTPTPDLNRIPGPSGVTSQWPLFAGVGLAAALIGGAFFIRYLRNRRTRK